MSRSRTRARNRRARHELIRAEFQVELEVLLERVQSPANFADRIDTTDRISNLFQPIALSAVPLWPFVRQACPEVAHDKRIVEDREAVLAMIAEIVARPLAGCSRRHEDEAGNKRCRNVLRAIMGKVARVKEQVQLYTQQTGRSREDFVLRKQEVESGEFDERDAE